MSSNGRVIHCISAYLPSYITLIRLLLVSSTHTNFLLFQSFILLYFTTDNADIYFTKPRRKIIKWITLFLFVRLADQNSTLGITCSYRWLLAKNIQRQYEKTQFVKTGFISAIKLSTEIKQLQHEIFPAKIFIQNYFPFASNKLFPYLREKDYIFV